MKAVVSCTADGLRTIAFAASELRPPHRPHLSEKKLPESAALSFAADDADDADAKFPTLQDDGDAKLF